MKRPSKPFRKGFTLIELLVVIAIIGLLSSVVLASLNTARAKARDSNRRASLSSLANAVELYYLENGNYPPSGGWFTNPSHGGLDPLLVPKHIPAVPDDPAPSRIHVFMYWQHDASLAAYCSGLTQDATKYGFYARLESPTAADQATMTGPVSQCVGTYFGMNYRRGN